ncbi:hypothetical protein CARUB_v10019632mg [Capsella rubella]|uniref:Uncharacterized protein n=1 Tax=Capsella rubella TaxID=81985 RepID=R0HLT6_9BRAS|nr:hypothetical protein CARUB_v10019632mg [Capsella rubella]
MTNLRRSNKDSGERIYSDKETSIDSWVFSPTTSESNLQMEREQLKALLICYQKHLLFFNLICNLCIHSCNSQKLKRNKSESSIFKR